MVVVGDLLTRRHHEPHQTPAPRVEVGRALGHQLDPAPSGRLGAHRAGARRPPPLRPPASPHQKPELPELRGQLARQRLKHRRPAERRRPRPAGRAHPGRGEQVGQRAQAPAEGPALAPGQRPHGPDLCQNAVPAANPQTDGQGAIGAQGAGSAGGGCGHGAR